MIAPEGIRDGRYFAEALYTFAGEGVEDLPFKKGDLIEVLDCADANWWRGKILNTMEDGLFPACLVKFTDAPVAEKAMKTAERLAHLSDVLTPSYAKGHESSNSSSNEANGSKDANSIESLLLNLANNEMQVQQQKVQAHMPRKPTRMKLLYEDHTQEGSSGRASAMSTHSEVASSPQKPYKRPPLSANLPSIPQSKPPQTKQSNSARSLNQAGLWSPAQSSTQQAPSAYDSSFASSLEGMREATARTEEATRNRSSASMLFGPRGMPASSSSRSSSRVHNASMRSEQSSMSSHNNLSTQDIYSQPDTSRTSYVSLYSLSDGGSTVAKSSRAAHEAAISEARQLMDGIPSPTEQSTSGRHEADYLFDDDSDPEEKTNNSKLQSMLSPASENSARFASYPSTVSSHASSIGDTSKSKRLPTIPSTANNSVISDTSSLGLAGNSSVGDLTQLHRSWYSSSDSINLVGGGELRSPEPNATECYDDNIDAYAPKTAKTKSRIRPTTGTMRQTESEGKAKSTAPESVQAYADIRQNYDELASDFQPTANISTNANGHNGYFNSNTPPTSSTGHSYSTPQQQHVYVAGMVPTQTMANGYYEGNSYPGSGSYGFSNTMPQQYAGYQNAYPGYDTNGQASTTYQQPQQMYYNQPLQSGAAVNMAASAPSHEHVHANYYDPMQNMAAQHQQQPYTRETASAMSNRPISTGAAAVAAGNNVLLNTGFVPPTTVDGNARPRSYTVGTQSGDGSSGSVLGRAGTIMPQQQGNGVAIPNMKQDISASNANMERAASFDGSSTVAGSLTSNTLHSTAAPESGHSFRGDGSARGSITPTGFGTLSSTPPASFARRDGGMSPFPSNVGPSRQTTLMPGAEISASKDITCIEELDPQLKQPLPPNVTPINYVKMTRPVFKYGGHISHPETGNWAKIDRQMTMLKSVSVKLTVEALATMHVGRPFNRPTERVRAAFTWIASNIQYDTSVAESNEEFEQHEEPNAVLQRRRSRGPGFAYLFDAMMAALAIESHTVRGYLRQPLDTYQGVVLPAANHVWNVVCLDGEFRLVDTACAARSHPLNAESRTDPWFFLASPKETIFTHFPLAATDQFVDPVVPLPVFWMLPYVRPNYFQSRVKLLNLPHLPHIALKDDKVTPLVMCVRDSTMSVYAEVELHDSNGSGRIVARQPLLAQCMDYKGKRMVKVLASVRGAEVHGLIKIYCGVRVPLQPKKLSEESSSAVGKAQKVLGFLQSKDRRPSAHDYSRIRDVDEDGSIKTVATSRTFPLACVLPVVHRGRSNAATFVQPNAALPNEFYIKEPTESQLHLGESIIFHLLPVGDERLFHMQLRSPSGQQHKFVYQPSDQGYILRHTVKERGAWIIIFHSDSEGWLPIVSYSCV
ncbi:hypothetical protein COEREDRAFT_85568 [Coemansia reversa NRRL 1564]|uniref:SH3 domain-containing protein n=1 Tax=Coemansia reversa (strain ATCC 12441 / NRRL 1564) TaxID=763665 RepID=A0A2G5BHA4_COERN|nr:hypothetical protein COEREDRAFT_85568 [Coemansia reversa NRRL 1564]|eukprot:PIA18107.1 hypothetical protein COEREDRAFT_85568 [Coemansia reversa NRRL 1564]